MVMDFPDVDNIRQPKDVEKQFQGVREEFERLRDQLDMLYHEGVATQSSVIRQAVALANGIDPNWYSITIWDAGDEKSVDNKRIEVGPADLRIFMNGPLRGDVDLTESLKDLLSQPHTLSHIRYYYTEEEERGPRVYFQYINPNHKWELAVGKVIFEMESGDIGYASSVNDDGSFNITSISSCGDDGKGFVWEYTLQRLNDDLDPLMTDMEHITGVENVSYVPFRLPLSVFGHEVFPSIEYYETVCKQRCDEYFRKHPPQD